MAGAKIFLTDYYVYALLRTDGTPFYVGKGRGSRWLDHERRKRRETHKDRIITQLLSDIGYVPKIKLIEGLTDKLARQIESDLIHLIGRSPNGPLVNATKGGEGAKPFRLPSEARALISESNRRRGVSEETKSKISQSAKRRSQTPEGKDHLRRMKSSFSWDGRTHSFETIKKMRAAQRRLSWRRKRAAHNYSFDFIHDNDDD